MVSIPCNFAASARFSKLTQVTSPQYFDHHFAPSFLKCRAPTHPTATAASASASSSDPPQRQPRTLFPGGFKRPEIKVPTLALRVSADEVLGSKGLSAIGAMISRGVGIVTLYGGDESSGRLYEAACVLRSVIGDRAYLIIAERVDIAAAVGASGVLLSDQGIPTIVARNMMMKSKPDAVYLPLVARSVQTLESARNATISEGADFFVTSTAGLDYASLLANSVTKHIKVPIFFNVVDFIRDDLPSNVLSKLLQSGACGVIVSLDDLKLLGDEFMREMFSTVYEVDKTLLNEFPNSNRIESNNVRVVNGKKGISGFVKLDDNEMQLIEAERHLLHEAVAVIRKATPMHTGSTVKVHVYVQ